MTEERLFLTPAEAESLLPAQDHNFVEAGPRLLGCDYDREDTLKAFDEAKSIEIGGPECKSMRHPIVVTEKNGRISFFEADMDKVAAFEAART